MRSRKFKICAFVKIILASNPVAIMKRRITINEEVTKYNQGTGFECYRHWIVTVYDEYGNYLNLSTSDSFDDALDHIKTIDWNHLPMSWFQPHKWG